MIATEKQLFIWCESFCITFRFHTEGKVCLSLKRYLYFANAAADVLQKDI